MRLRVSSKPRRLLLGALLAFLVLAMTSTALSAEVVTSTVTVGRTPVAFGVNPLSHKVYVANFFGDTVSVIDGASESVVATLTMPSSFNVPNAVVVNPLVTPARAYVANFWAQNVVAIDESSMAVTDVISNLGVHAGGPRALALDPTSTPPKLYVACYGSGSIAVIDLTTNEVTEEIDVGGQPRALAIAAAAGRRRVYAAVDGTNEVAVIDGATDTLVALLPAGLRPKAVAVDSDRGYAYVTNEASGTVTVIDDADEVTATIPVGTTPRGIAVDGAGGRAYVANWGSGSVSVIDLSSNAVTATVSVGTNPFSASFDPASGNAYVTDYGSGQVSIIDPSLSCSNLSVGIQPMPVATDAGLSPRKTYVGNSGSGTVSIISEAGGSGFGMLEPTVAYAAPRPSAVISIDSVTPTPDGRIQVQGTAEDIRAPYVSGIVAVLWRPEGEVAWRRAEVGEGLGTPTARWSATVPAGDERLEVAVVDEASSVSSSCYGSGGAANVALAAVDALDLASDTEAPAMSDVRTTPSAVRAGEAATISAIADDSERGGSAIVSMDVAIAGGDWAAMLPKDGAFDEPAEEAEAEAVFSSAGMVPVEVRAADAAGNAGTAEPVVVPVFDPSAGRLVAAGWVADASGGARGRRRLTFGAAAGYDRREYLRGRLHAALPDRRILRKADLAWLVVDGDGAVLSGRGELDGQDCAFTFCAREAVGGDPARIRLTVRDLDGALLYDSGGDPERWWEPGSPLGGGTVRIGF